MQSRILHAINDQGAEVLGNLLAQFFEALVPAFRDKADEIQIERMEAGAKITYNGKSVSVSLTSQRGYPAIAFSRIRILSGLTINSDGPRQTGKFRVQYNDEFIPVNVSMHTENDKREIMTLQPAWNEVEFNHVKKSGLE
jgi:hypothetical protein